MKADSKKLQFDTDFLHDSMLRNGAEALGRKLLDIIEEGIRYCIEKHVRDEVLKGIEFHESYLKQKDIKNAAVKNSLLLVLSQKHAFYSAKCGLLVWNFKHFDPATPVEIVSKTQTEIESLQKKIDEVLVEMKNLE